MSDIPADQHFMRYSARKFIIPKKDGTHYISPLNFYLRENKGETYLSGIWYEFLRPGTEEDAIQKAVAFMKNKGFRAVNGAFSLHKIEDILAKSTDEVQYAVRHLSRCDDAYAGILPDPSTLHDAEAIAETVNKVFKLR